MLLKKGGVCLISYSILPFLLLISFSYKKQLISIDVSQCEDGPMDVFCCLEVKILLLQIEVQCCKNYDK